MNLMKKVSAIESDITEIKFLLKQKNQSNQKEILSAQEVMDLLKINRTTFGKWRDIGFLKVMKINRRLYCRYSQIIEALENGIIEQKNQ